MFLRSLTLKGFKSFAEATTLEFEPGLTVVVGPNGSGKSNVVDAVAWVLGAQGPRTVRSTRMDDVIFAGTGRRPALGRAEVSLTIDNTRGVLPIDFTEVTITRTLFRTSGESEYTLNGVPCRLLDLQELLSDSGVGRQQHIIVSQGNLDAILDSRPEDRRLIVEEAAGILKYRRRKEKAERRLEGTEANLVRLTDLLREVGRQLRPLERQAEAARRHGDLVGELHALRVFLRGREVAALTVRHEAAVQAGAGLGGEQARVKAELEVLDASVAAAESRVSELGRARLGTLSLSDGVGRLEALRERTRGLVAVVAERRRSVERDLAVSVDSALIAALDDDAARLRAELADVEAAAASMAARFEELTRGEADLVRERAALGEPSTRSNAAAEARGELGALRANLDRGRADLARLEHRLAGLDTRAVLLGDEADRVRVELGRLAGVEAETVAARDQAEAERRATAKALITAEATAREATAGHRTWVARAEALALAVAEATGRGDTDRLAGVAGVVGTLVDLVDVESGYEAAFEAAVVEAVGAVVVDGVAAGRRLLDELAGALPAGVLPLGSLLDPPASVSSHCPARPLHSVVRSSHPGVARLLRHLLADVVVVDGGWEEAVDVTLAFPDVVAVTRAGDRISSVGWRLGVGAPGVTRAALDEAHTRAVELAEAAAAAAARLGQAADAA
ncbi:MAG: chromosome segregation protein, partial [Actinomycetota bacterium]|nr:chromosome segregation protein [Actinomycetota bacterium]